MKQIAAGAGGIMLGVMVILSVFAIWTPGPDSARLFGTGIVVGFAGFVLVMIGISP